MTLPKCFEKNPRFIASGILHSKMLSLQLLRSYHIFNLIVYNLRNNLFRCELILLYIQPVVDDFCRIGIPDSRD
jgi:hypothetical protein